MTDEDERSLAAEVLYEGVRHRVLVLFPSEFWAYVGHLSDSDQWRVFALVAESAEHGIPRHNPEKCLRLKGEAYAGIWELKAKAQRLLFFVHGSDLVITNWFRKQRERGEPAEYRRACQRRDLYLQTMEGPS